ncbi:MAG: aminotransferase class V-fold PLP-dependent enzyme [SAR324 cluster bacterium]|nr:aminotransferase class V-fold PLP-dependent enzyme [SAR324 cluster bacterium]
MLACQRHLFSLPDTVHYLNCAYMGPLLKTTEAAGIAGLRRKSVPTDIVQEDFFAPVEELRKLVGRLVNASPERVAMIPAVSYGVAIAAHNLPLRAGQNIVSPGEEFPSNVRAWQERCAEAGAELRMVPRPTDVQHAGTVWNEALLEAIDDDTALVSLTAVHWTDGTRFDLERIGARAREAGALFVVDGTQSVGAAPFDFEAVQPDLLICAGYKWCLGPYQSGFAVLGERLLEGQPFEMTWIGRVGAEDFANLVNYQEGYRPGARRFDVGEHSNFVNVPMLSEALRQILEWGVENIRDYCGNLVGAVRKALRGSEFALAAPETQIPHMFGIHVPDPGRVPLILEELRRREIYVSLRGSSLRVSPHVYNTEDDMVALAGALLDTAR